MRFDEALQRLIQVIDRMYTAGIKEFQNSAKLRIAYSFFLLERMKNQNRALEELEIAQQLKPQFDEEFLIYRYTKMINETMGDGNKEAEVKEEVDVVVMIAFQNAKKLCVEFIKQASQHHKDFWMELLEDLPSRIISLTNRHGQTQQDRFQN